MRNENYHNPNRLIRLPEVEEQNQSGKIPQKHTSNLSCYRLEIWRCTELD